MWKHRAYAKAIIRQKEIKLKATTQLIYLMLADHANEQTHSTYFTTQRLCDMTQCVRNTVRDAVKTLEKNNLISTLYTPGKSPTYTVHIPYGFNAGSDTAVATVSRAYVPTHGELAAAAMDQALRLTGISAEQMALMVFTGIEGMSATEARDRAERLFADSGLSPARTIIEQVGIALNSPVARTEAELQVMRDREQEALQGHRKRALAEQLSKWEAGRTGESYEQQAKRCKVGFPGTDDELLEWLVPDAVALGR